MINTLKFRVINESTKKTDKHDASTSSEFLSKDMLPKSYVCSKETENLRRLLKSRERLVRPAVGQTNEIHALLVSIGFSDELRSLQTKKGRQKVLDALESNDDCVLRGNFVSDNELHSHSEGSVSKTDDFHYKTNGDFGKGHREAAGGLTKDDGMVRRLLTIRGCGNITTWTIRAYTEAISRFPNAKKYTAFCGLVPWVQDSDETVHHGRITKHGSQELRNGFVQLVLGIRRCKDTSDWRMMQRYEYMKKNKGSGKSIVAAARKLAEIVWTMLSEKQDFDCSRMKGTYKIPNLVSQALAG